ncbi:MAG: phosphoglycolate phosphatase [Pseudomonadota bacterium]
MGPRDHCTKDGASHLKSLIENYWRRKGFDVDVELVSEGFVPAMRSGRTDLRSNMINGMPTIRRPESHAA